MDAIALEIPRQAAAAFDRRSNHPDRRLQSAAFARAAWFGGRRELGGRRAGEDRNCFVDSHGPRLFAIVVGVTALNFLDAWFTVLNGEILATP